MPLICHVDGKQVHLNDDLEATITAAGGYEQLTATCSRDDVAHAHQGSHISLETQARHEVWFGSLDATPALSRFPVAKILASGPIGKANKQRSNRLYQTRDYSLWKPITSDPYNYTGPGSLNIRQSISADGQEGRFVWAVTNGTDIKQNDANGLIAWFHGENVTRIAFDWTVSAATANYTLRIYTGTGPSGTLTQRGSDMVAGAGASGSQDVTLSAGDDDLIALIFYRNGADATMSLNSWLRVGNLRVNGRTLGDDFSPGQIIEDMAGYLGWNTQGVQSSGTNALPWYWQGGSWGDAFSELANLDDWPFLVTRNAINYSPWGERWDLRFSQEHEDLDFPPIYNSVRVFYTTLAGSTRSVKLQAAPDPLARFGEDNEYQYDLSQSYSEDTIPKAVAAALLERVSEQRVIGTVRVEKLDTNKRVWTPRKRFTVGTTERIYHIQPGDLARLEPYPKLGPQRIVGVRLHANDVELEFGEDIEQVSASRTLARIAGQRSRQRRKLGRR